MLHTRAPLLDLHGELAWRRALHLSERLPREAGPSPLAAASDDGDPDLALRRLAEWRSQSPFGQEEWLACRLRLDGLDEAAFLKLLGESDRALFARSPQPPDWLLSLETLLQGNPRAPHGGSALHGLFTPLLTGAISRAFEQVRDNAADLLREHGLAIFDPQTVAPLLFTGMADRLDWMLARAVVLEMQVARLTGQLSGATSSERFKNFLSALAEPARWHAFLLEYPVLARLLAEALERWTAVSTEVLARLCADWRDLRATFWQGEDPGLLRAVSGGAGDSHAGGRAVRVLRFETGARVVYKPRPMGVDVRFGELLSWLNERGAPDLRAATVLAREGYGWMRFVEPRPCQTRDELRRFYRRQGAFLVLLYVLNANDFHRENLIAAGEHPLLIDLESLCAPDYGRSDPTTFDSLAQYELNDSVIRVMLLPFFHENKTGEVVDLSGLGGGDDELSAHEGLVWEAAGTDEMRLVRQRLRSAQSENRPMFLGKV
ncbi:MAG TPA: type 2 lanthipeptide synthetase LanM, partial [Thermoanaerobaculia bacterium]